MDILIVDDEPISTHLHGAYVRKLANCKAVCFGNPCDALTWAATHNPALVIVDYLMPVMDGVEFTRRFRRLPGKETAPVLMITGFGDTDVRQLARSVGVSEFLTKPVDRIQLRACVLSVLAACSAPEKALASRSAPEHCDGIDADALATILVERDRVRAMQTGTQP